MENDFVKQAERLVAARRAITRAHYEALDTRLRRQASSPKLIGGVLLGAIAIAYLAFGRSGKGKRVSKESGILPLVLKAAQIAVPLVGTLHAAREAKAARKTVSRATGTPEVKPEDV